VQSRVEDPDPPIMVVKESEHRSSVELVVGVSVTVLVNPFTEAIVIVDEPFVPAMTATLVGAAVTAKSSTW
jgi:hypothetical protein